MERTDDGAATGMMPDARAAADDVALEQRVALVDLVNRVLDRGVCVSGDVVISLAGVDLLYVGLNVILGSVEALDRSGLSDPGDTDRRTDRIDQADRTDSVADGDG